ncbi:MAG TPA: LCP family protein [Acidimicrobiales bacterium]
MARRRSPDAPGASPPGRPHHARPRQHRTWWQRLALATGCLSVVGLAASAFGLGYVYRKYERLPRVELSGVLDDDVDAGEPENYLIVGVDNASRLADDDPIRAGRDTLSRSDTIMILRIDPGSRRAALLSLPRDLWVPIAGTGSNQRINTTVERGGPELLIRTIHDYLGIPINHYVQIDFAAFRGLVTAVGGVPVYIPRPARDRQTGLYLPERGCVTLDPTQALAYVRSRHYEELVRGDWQEDARSDLGRIERQQDFIRRALTRAVDQGPRNPGKLDDLIDVALTAITVDDGLTADDIFRLGNRFRSFEPEDLVTYSVPTIDDRVGEAEILRLVEDQAEPVLAIFRGAPAPSTSTGSTGSTGPAGTGSDGTASGGTGGDGTTGGSGADGTGTGTTGEPTVTPASVRLQVLNGSGRSGEASEASNDLVTAGFGVSGIGEAPSFDHERTEVRYAPGHEAEADLVSRWLRSGADLVEDADVAGVVLVTGADWQGLRSSAAAVTTTTVGDGGDRTGGDGSSTSTTVGLSDVTGTVPPADGVGTGSTGSTGAGTTGTGSTSTTLDPAARAC